MGLEIRNVFDRKTGQCTCLHSSDGEHWYMPDGTPTPLPHEKGSLVRDDNTAIDLIGAAVGVAAVTFLSWIIDYLLIVVIIYDA